MQDQLKVHLIQTDTVWKNITENIENISQKISQITEQADLFVLPEMFSTGFVMEPSEVAEPMDGTAVTWMIDTAKSKDCAITGSLIIKENNKFYNRLIFVHPSGEIEYYNKKHLFSHAGEDKVYTTGTERKIIEYKGWKIAAFVCYDLRFPVWSRNTENYHIALYVANWPKTRINAWDILLKARAIENICYTIGVNRIGIDANELEYIGHSQITNPLGNNIKKSTIAVEDIISTTLYKAEILKDRKDFKFLEDRDDFQLKN
ncbi:nitrilase family protein [Flavicella sp.]|uniref:nitrilase family protein n=1 Tax=Flavicella sp. TaxID=2957742 RepID=UPI0026296CB5|nr:nitrilase family protein [Flavicella sp.]MDG1805796.1 nitrilase family protein [Flavicella sp.]MDG2280758.1 nitrilase family protein [Flavicella sp.]